MSVMTQPGQTEGYTASDHVRAILDYLDGALDAVIVNAGRPSRDVLDRYAADGAELVHIDPALYELGPEIVEADLVENGTHRPVPWEKHDLLRHSPQQVASVLIQQIGRHGC